ncbi:MAG TPA: ATP-binding protein [Bifidobacterium adolescentis]|nr:ATP-binding protein [Bifidobacterium adolescentis]
MIIDSETKRKLREMNAAELLDAFERLDERTVMPLNHAEVVGLAVDNAYGGYTDAKIQRLVKRAGLRYPQADLRTIDLAEERGLDRGVLAGLDAGNYLGQRLNVAFQGATGSGKSFLLCALVKSACRGRYRACYIRMPDLAEQVAAAALKPGGPAKLVRKYVYGQINVYGVTTKSERHKRSYWTRTADGNGIGGRKAPVPYGS